MKLFLLTLSLEDVPLSLLLATLSVSEAICCTMSWFGTLPSCNERSRSSPDLLDFFFAFFLPTFFGMTSKNTSIVSLSQIDISTETTGTAKRRNRHRGVKELSRKELAVRHIVYLRCQVFILDPVLSQAGRSVDIPHTNRFISVFQEKCHVMDFP